MNEIGLNQKPAQAEAPVEADLDADAQIRHLHADMPRPNAAEEDRRAGLAAVTGDHYEGGHWLGSFATYLVTRRGVGAP